MAQHRWQVLLSQVAAWAEYATRIQADWDYLFVRYLLTIFQRPDAVPVRHKPARLSMEQRLAVDAYVDELEALGLIEEPAVVNTAAPIIPYG